MQEAEGEPMQRANRIRIRLLEGNGPRDSRLREVGPMPRRASDRAAGFDVVAWCAEPTPISPQQWVKIGCGFALELPPGFEAQMRPRSGLALKNGVTLLNSPGTVDPDYRGEVSVILFNGGSRTFVVEPGMRVAQMVVQALPAVELEVAADLDESARGAGGFGSTGLY